MLVKNSVLFSLILASLATSLPARAQSMKFAVVDLQRALNETEEGRTAKAKLQGVFKQRQDALDKKQAELKKMKDDIEKQKKVLSKDILQQRMEAYQKSFVELQTKYVEYQRELAQKEAAMTKGILEKMQAILRRIGQAEGYTLIVERNEGGVVWVPNHLDLTDRVIQNYNTTKGVAPAEGADAKGAEGAKKPASGGKKK